MSRHFISLNPNTKRMLIYGPDMALRRMADDEFEAFDPDVQAALLRYHKTFRAAANAMADSRVSAIMLKIPKS